MWSLEGERDGERREGGREERGRKRRDGGEGGGIRSKHKVANAFVMYAYAYHVPCVLVRV